MPLLIKGLTELRTRLARLRPDELLATALAEQAERLGQAVRDGLGEPQGAGEHDKPWRRTGALHDSIAVSAAGLEAAVGSNDPAAAPQEHGTSRIPPRPFLAPVAAERAEAISKAIGQTIATHFGGDDAPSD